MACKEYRGKKKKAGAIQKRGNYVQKLDRGKVGRKLKPRGVKVAIVSTKLPDEEKLIRR